MGLDGCVIRCPASVGDLAAAPHSGVLWRAAPGRLLLEVPDVARYLVSDGNLVEIELCGAATAGEVRRFLRMTPTAALCLQRGIPVLHAAVAADPAGNAVMLAGNSSAGKSVLLAALVQRGWGLLTDDLAPVILDDVGVPTAVPTWPEMILWPDSVGGGATSVADGPDVTEFGSSASRRAVGREAGFVDEARPVRAIWWLGVHGFDPIEVHAVEGISRFEAFGAMGYHQRIASALLDRASYLTVAGTVAGSGIPIRRLIRPRGRWTAGELADIVEDDNRSGP
jgi:hypothetical protein